MRAYAHRWGRAVMVVTGPGGQRDYELMMGLVPSAALV